eukprot:TRINITY_DN4487_c0_g1_i2.p1 TRINITY_DN4487_c0_g1~~TRINITY_DN4487_c0_g1_i2.p1  ORF type:complete len:397 (-),score=104.56 TRINITY_DN4487_c0_g1_i2:492-1637(-)
MLDLFLVASVFTSLIVLYWQFGEKRKSDPISFTVHSRPPEDPSYESNESRPMSPSKGRMFFAKESNPLTANVFHPDRSDVKLVIVLVGLPARGKSFIAFKIGRYLRWLGHQTKIFEEHFRSNNSNKQLDEALTWLKEGGGQICIYDDTNHTRERRVEVLERIRLGLPNVRLMFIESVCDRDRLINDNIAFHVEEIPEQDIDELKERIRSMEGDYEAMSPSNCSGVSFIKIYNGGDSIFVHKIWGYLPSRIASLLMNIRLRSIPMFFSRHGQSMFNLEDRIGGDSGLSPAGQDYAHKLGDFVKQHPILRESKTVWHSTLRRTKETAEFTGAANVVEWHNLREIDAGLCEGMTYGEVEAQMPQEFKDRAKDKLNYRYPRLVTH